MPGLGLSPGCQCCGGPPVYMLYVTVTVLDDSDLRDYTSVVCTFFPPVTDITYEFSVTGGSYSVELQPTLTYDFGNIGSYDIVSASQGTCFSISIDQFLVENASDSTLQFLDTDGLTDSIFNDGTGTNEFDVFQNAASFSPESGSYTAGIQYTDSMGDPQFREVLEIDWYTIEE